MSDSRRKFIRKATAAMAAGANIGTPITALSKENSGTVKMLTPDGKLVEVPAEIVDKSSKESASNKKILDWRETKGE